MKDLSLITATGLPVLVATLKVAVIAGAGYWLAWRKLLHEAALRDLSALVVNVTVPCLVFSTAAQGVIGLSGVDAVALVAAAPIVIGIGWIIGWALLRLGRLDSSAIKPVVLSTAFANSSYLPIAVATSVIPALAAHFPAVAAKSISQTSVVCISIYTILYAPLFWGYAFWWLKGEPAAKLKPSQLLSPPVIGLSLGYAVGLTRLHLAITPGGSPLHFLLLGIQDIGGMTIPLANLILGGMLCTARALRVAEGSSALISGVGRLLTVVGKLVLVPTVVFGALALTSQIWNHGDMLTLAAAIILLESATPGATNLAVIGGSGAETRTGMAISEILLAQYPVCIVTIPVWLTLFFSLLQRH